MLRTNPPCFAAWSITLVDNELVIRLTRSKCDWIQVILHDVLLFEMADNKLVIRLTRSFIMFFF
jgi:hypothetical protein